MAVTVATLPPSGIINHVYICTFFFSWLHTEPNHVLYSGVVEHIHEELEKTKSKKLVVFILVNLSQKRPRRGAEDDQEPIKYGEVFNVRGELASKPIAPRDAATLQSAEAQVLGDTQKGGPAALMESAAAYNERAGLVSHDTVTDLARNKGVSVSETKEGRSPVITDTVGGQYVQPADVAKRNSGTHAVNEGDAASTQPPGFRATLDNDFISEQGGATLDPRLVHNEDNNNTLSFVSSDKQDTGEARDSVISGIPGGMGASMATADHRVKKNK